MSRLGGVIPVLSVMGDSIAEAWEKSLLELWNKGCRIRTQYDQKDKDGNWLYPPSVDATLMMTALKPSSEPAIHRAFPGGLEDLEEYRQEVVDGIKDHWCRSGKEVDGTKWEYTYHERLTRYGLPKAHVNVELESCDTGTFEGLELESPPMDQLWQMVEMLAESPISRRVQAVTWQPWKDPNCTDPPCLQSLWCRILPDKNDIWHLNMNVRFRSRDAFKASFMNVWALVCLQERLAEQIAEKADREVRLGHYCDLSDSYHIYGSDCEEFGSRFLKLMKERSFEDRTWTREFAEPFFTEARPAIAEKLRKQEEVWDAARVRGL